jgi:two-component sensor histidine kinase
MGSPRRARRQGQGPQNGCMEAGRLQFDWEGIVARDFEPASREGFGTEILTKAVPKNLGGHAVYEVKDGRVLWMLDVPLRQ